MSKAAPPYAFPNPSRPIPGDPVGPTPPRAEVRRFNGPLWVVAQSIVRIVRLRIQVFGRWGGGARRWALCGVGRVGPIFAVFYCVPRRF